MSLRRLARRKRNEAGCNGIGIGCNFPSVSSSHYRMEISMFSSCGMRNTMVALLIAFAASTGCSAAARAPIPPPASDSALAQSPGKQTAVFAGGCFWGTQSVFERVKGVLATTAGYAGGSADTATYDHGTTGTTGHAESVKVVFDPSKTSYGQHIP